MKNATHELKTWPEYFQKVLNGTKKFEIRKNDRGFEVGDILVLKEWEPSGYSTVSPNTFEGKYTGRQTTKEITYILEGSDFGMMPGYCIMSLTD